MSEIYDTSILPQQVQDKLEELDLELRNEEITQKGFDKKRRSILEPFLKISPSILSSIPQHSNVSNVLIDASQLSIEGNSATVSSHPQSPIDNSLLADDIDFNFQNDFTISLHKGAVQAAILSHNVDTSGPVSSKRTLWPKTLDDPIANFSNYNKSKIPPAKSPKPSKSHPTVKCLTSVTESHFQIEEDISEYLLDSSNKTLHNNDVLHPNFHSKHQGGVSDKIQALLTTLQRPKLRDSSFVEELYFDLDYDLAPKQDLNAPTPIGSIMQPAVGPLPNLNCEDFSIIEQLMKNSQNKKAVAFTCFDLNSKPTISITYEKFFQKVSKVGFTLLHKTQGLNEGSRIALVFSSGEPISVATAFYGCLSVNIIPLLIDPPNFRDEPGIQRIGFLLGTLGIFHALSSESTLRGLPRDDSGHIYLFKGWPKLQWLQLDSTSKPTKDFKFPSNIDSQAVAYIESTADKDGTILGVSISHSSLLAHTKILVQNCSYFKGETIICTEDSKRNVGLWHGILASTYAGSHVIFIPSFILNSVPLIWLHMVHKFEATCVITSSRVLNSSIAYSQAHELRYMTLEHVRMFLIKDGQNPWSLGSCDAFIESFNSKGVKTESLVLCSTSAETLTVSIRKPQQYTCARGVLSIQGLSYGIIRVEEEGTFISLTLQDVGYVLPGSRVAIVKIDGPPFICKTDEIGEICVSSSSCGSEYWGLKGKSSLIFNVLPLGNDNKPYGTSYFIRSRLIGFIGAEGKVFVCGNLDGLIQSSGRRHNRDDIIATVLAVDPPLFIFKNRVAVFSIPILKDNRIIVIAELSCACSDEVAYKWMNTVVSAIETIHYISLYGVMLIKANTLPKIQGSIYIPGTITQYFEGTFLYDHQLMCPHQCITNIPIIQNRFNFKNSPGYMIGGIVRTTKSSILEGDPLILKCQDNPIRNVSSLLEIKAYESPDQLLLSILDNRCKLSAPLTTGQLFKKAERIGSLLIEKGKLCSGQVLIILLPPNSDLLNAFYGATIVGLIPIVLRCPSIHNYYSQLPTIKNIIERSNSSLILTSSSFIKILKSKEASSFFDLKTFPPLLSVDDVSKKKIDKLYKPPTDEMIAYIDYALSAHGVLTGVNISHQTVINFCKAYQQHSEIVTGSTILFCLDPYTGFSLMSFFFSSLYSNNYIIYLSLIEFENNPLLFFQAISHHKIKEIYCSYIVIELCCKELNNTVINLKSKGFDLSSLLSIVVFGEERPRVNILYQFTTIFNSLGLNQLKVSASFGCRVNPVICLNCTQHEEPYQIYIDGRMLKLDKIKRVERGVPYSLMLISSGKIFPGTRIIIVNNESNMVCPEGDIGEIWVQGTSNVTSYYGNDKTIEKLNLSHFNVSPGGVDLDNNKFCRTFVLGFVFSEKNNDHVIQNLFILGSIEGSLYLENLRYYPSDLEATVNRCHGITISAVFEGNNLLVVVAEQDVSERDPLSVVPHITTALIDDHHIIVGVVVIVDPKVIPINSKGEIQRLYLKDAFLSDELDPLYVAYNL